MVDLFRCAFPPLLMTLIKPLSRVLAVVVGRSARIWWQRLPKEHKFQARLALLQHRWSVLFRILDPNIFHPGSASKNLSN
jgi:hypothetical protein